jgi:hypothetical protein
MELTRRAILPAPILVATLAGAQAAEAALPLRVVATADGPYVSRVIDHDGGARRAAPAPRPRTMAEHNQDSYLWQIG